MLDFIPVLQDIDMIENIRSVYALPPVYILMKNCDIADSEGKTTADIKEKEDAEDENADGDDDDDDDDDEEEVEMFTI